MSKVEFCKGMRLLVPDLADQDDRLSELFWAVDTDHTYKVRHCPPHLYLSWQLRSGDSLLPCQRLTSLCLHWMCSQISYNQFVEKFRLDKPTEVGELTTRTNNIETLVKEVGSHQ